MRAQDYAFIGQLSFKKQQEKRLWLDFHALVKLAHPPDYLFVCAHDTYIPYKVEEWNVEPHRPSASLQLEGIAHMEQLPGRKLFIKRSDIPAAPAQGEDRWLGYEVHDAEGVFLGILEEIIRRPGQSLLSIDHRGGSLWVPLHPKLLTEVDHRRHHLRLALPPGYLAAMASS